MSWSGSELAAFRDVVAGLGRLPYKPELLPLGDDIETALSTEGDSGAHIVLLPRPGRIAELAEAQQLKPFDDEAWGTGEEYYSAKWKDLLFHEHEHTTRPFALPFKAAHKSLVWYDRRVFEEHELGDPNSWALANWYAAIDKLAATDVRLLSLAAADGWMLTDFFENMLLAQSPRTYRVFAEADHRSWESFGVRAALSELGTLWGRRDVFPDGVGRALVSQFPDAVQDVFERGLAAMVLAPDFAEPVVQKSIRGRADAREAVGVFRFRAYYGPLPPPVGGGDVIVLTASATDSARDLARRLGDPSAPLPWISKHGGFIAANNKTNDLIQNLKSSSRHPERIGYSPALSRVQQGLNNKLRFDLSDRIGAVGGRDALWRVLTEFLLEVGDGRVEEKPYVLDAAVDSAIDKLQSYEDELSG